MGKTPVISIVLNAHLPFISAVGSPPGTPAPEEPRLFEALSETYIPLLRVFDRLDADHIPFRMAIALSPTLCHMLSDPALIRRYLAYVDRQIEFGAGECERTSRDSETGPLARMFYDQMVDKRILFTERYEGNILKTLDYFQRKGRLELLTTAATYAFLPFYTSCPEAVQAQLEAALASHRKIFGANPQGFWLPELGWSPELDRCLRAYNFGYTIVEAHGVLAGNAPPSRGTFYPLMTPSRLLIMARDHYARRDLCSADGGGFARDPRYLDYDKDAGYELPIEQVRRFIGTREGRARTGSRYWTIGAGCADRQVYDPAPAQALAQAQAHAFLDGRIARLKRAGELMEEIPVSLCAYEADAVGGRWYEGPLFLEALFREGVRREGEIRFMNPAEYLYKLERESFRTQTPEFSSWGANGYAEMWLDASNDWIYRYVMRSLDRMVELAERFPNESGLKERALNQAAREILLAQTSDWPRLLYKQEARAFARTQIEDALRNFTTIYESLGSNYISTEWLTSLERRHHCFPGINYRMFRRKR